MNQHAVNQSSDIRDMIHACAAGDPHARHRFQEEYSEDIYNFPVKVYGLSLEMAGDFYVYAFEKDRVFTRIRSFEGRNNIQFRTFLAYYVLKGLFIEWRRTEKEIETVSLNTPFEGAGESDLEDVLSDTVALQGEEGEKSEEENAHPENAMFRVWDSLSPEDRLDLKLLTLIECTLTPEEVRLLAHISGRSLHDTLAGLAGVQDGLKRKDEKLSRLRADLDSVWGWIMLRQKELQQIDEKILLIQEKGGSAEREPLHTQKHTLARALAKRHRQREKIMEEIRRYKMTTPYKDMARLLNTTVGTIGSRISRLRERLVQEFGER